MINKDLEYLRDKARAKKKEINYFMIQKISHL